MFVDDCSSNDTGPQIANSLRLDGSNDYLSKTFGAPTSATKSTFFAMVKRSKLGAAQTIYSGSNYETLSFNASDALVLSPNSGTPYYTSTSVFRDPSAWIPITVSIDTTLAVAADRVKVYVEDDLVTMTGGSVAQNAANVIWNASGGVGNIGRFAFSSNQYFDGYLSNICFIDGQALTPSDFGYTDTNNQWRSKSKAELTALASAGGANSFFLPFDDGASTATLGNDVSSKNNDWTLTNMVRDGSVNDCWSYDTPTNNFATLSAIDSKRTTSNGALNYAGSATGIVKGTQSNSSGKWYWEYQYNGGAAGGMVGIAPVGLAPTVSFLGAVGANTGYGYYSNGSKYGGVGGTLYGASWTTTDIIGVAMDMDAGTLTFYKNNVSQGVAFSSISGEFLPACGNSTTDDAGILNFGQRPVSGGAFDSASGGYFRYTPPSGFKALCTKNLPAPTGAAEKPWMHFNTVLDTGANIKSATEAIFPSNFFEWIKDRTNSNNHQLIDIVRGSSAVLQSNTTAAETTYTAPSGTSVGWVWKAGGAAVTNTAGSITGQVSANVAAGFSIVTWTATNAAATIGHGLGVAPKMIIIKDCDAAANWTVYHTSVGNTAGLALNSTGAQSSNILFWNNTSPTSTVFSVGSFSNYATDHHVACCFAEIPGYSKIGSYVGNGSADGPFVYCGFKPKYVMIKLSSSAGGNWITIDASRSPSNLADDMLFPNDPAAESTAVNFNADLVANGFKLRTSDSQSNGSGSTYIFIAFAEAPFKYSNAR